MLWKFVNVNRFVTRCCKPKKKILMVHTILFCFAICICMFWKCFIYSCKWQCQQDLFTLFKKFHNSTSFKLYEGISSTFFHINLNASVTVKAKTRWWHPSVTFLKINTLLGFHLTVFTCAACIRTHNYKVDHSRHHN